MNISLIFIMTLRLHFKLQIYELVVQFHMGI